MKHWLKPAAVTAIYGAFGLLWILTTDWLAEHVFARYAGHALIQTGKGILFITITTALVYLLTKSSARMLEKRQVWTRDLFDSNPDPTLLINEQGRITDCNKAALSRYGYSRSSLVSQHISSLLVPNERSSRELSEEIMAGFSAPVRLFQHHADENGSSFAADLSGRAVVNEGKRILILSVRDVTTQVEMENRLRSSTELQRAMIKASPLAIFTISLAGTILNWNKSAERIFGWSAQEVVGKTNPIVPPSREDEYARLRDRAVSGNGFTEVEILRRRRDGSEIPISLSTAPIRERGGPVRAIMCVAADITERKRVEAALASGERRLRTLITQAPVGIFTLSLRGEVLQFNRTMRTILGYRTDEELSADIKQIPPALFHRREQMGELRRMLFRTQSVRSIEVPINDRNGKTVWLDLSARISRKEGGSPDSIEGFCIDITRRIETEMREKHLNSILHTIRDIKALVMEARSKQTLIETGCRLIISNRGYDYARIILVDQEHRLELAAESGSGEQPADSPSADQPHIVELLAEKMRDISSLVIDTELFRQLTAESSAEPSTARYICFALDHHAIRFGYLIVSADSRFIADEEESSLLEEMASDIAFSVHTINIREERDRAEKQRTQLERELLHTQKLEIIGNMAGGIAHDFNNLLQGIAGYAQLAHAELEQLPQALDARDYISEVSGGAERAAALTRQLLQFSRKMPVEPQIIQVNREIEQLLKMLQHLIGSRIKLFWKPADEVWDVFIDSSQFGQIITNLVVNARDAVSDNGTITIRTANVSLDEAYCRLNPECYAGDFVICSVTDDGCGMSEEIIAQVFEPFFTTKPVEKGTGLGLSTVYGIVRQSLGFIRLRSAPGAGSTFEIYLPKSGETALTRRHPLLRSPEAAQTSSGTFLVVDDEPQMLQLMELMLKSLGYTVIPFLNPDDAYAAAEQSKIPIDLLITKVALSDLTGMELHEKLKTHLPDLPCLYTSVYSAKVIVNKESGTRLHLLRKPFSLNELSRAIEEVISPRNR
jgi:PAS domain S-box-containing protein